MKRLIFLSSIFLLTIVTTGYGAPQKAPLGQCVRECVRAFNPTLADTGANEFLVTNIDQQDCVEICKESYTYGDCYAWEDSCCNLEYSGDDPDCASLPEGSPCKKDSQCKYGLICEKIASDYNGTCEIPQLQLVDYFQYRHYLLDPSNYTYNEFFQYRLNLFISEDQRDDPLDIVFKDETGNTYDPLDGFRGETFPQDFYSVEYSPDKGFGHYIPRHYNYIQRKYSKDIDFAPGVYTAIIDGHDVRSINFGGIVDLMPVSNITYHLNDDGLLSFGWVLPANNPDCQEIRLSLFDADWHTLLVIKMPPTVDNITIPQDLINKAVNSKGVSQFRWQVDTRHYTGDGMNDGRGIAYSLPLPWPLSSQN
jgi:hypothetical protein